MPSNYADCLLALSKNTAKNVSDVKRMYLTSNNFETSAIFYINDILYITFIRC